MRIARGAIRPLYTWSMQKVALRLLEILLLLDSQKPFGHKLLWKAVLLAQTQIRAVVVNNIRFSVLSKQLPTKCTLHGIKAIVLLNKQASPSFPFSTMSALPLWANARRALRK